MMQTIVIFALAAVGIDCADPSTASVPHTAARPAMASRRLICGGDGSVGCIVRSMRMDGRARTSTELAVVAEVTPSTASVHLSRLKDERLLNVLAQGKHRYYSLAGISVANVLESLSVLVGGARKEFVPRTPNRMRAARTCYDHMAGTVGVLLHDRLHAMGWLK